MKTKITILALSIFLLNTVYTNQTKAQRNISNSSSAFSVIRVFNSNEQTVNVMWNDSSFDEVEIFTDKGEVFMPTIPIFNSTQIHLNNLLDGIYYINFKQYGTVMTTKVIQVVGFQVITQSI